jgi:L-ascorbate metabolism protein UlaG (beta-lactamase superfamily)
LVEIAHHGLSAFTITGTKLSIVIDPGVSISSKADVIYITHPHIDHMRFLKQVIKVNPEATILATPAVLDRWKNPSNYILVVQGRSPVIKNSMFRFIELPHGFAKIQNLGLITEVDGISIVHTGDAKTIEPLKDMSTDILMVPIGGIFTASFYRINKELELFTKKPPIVVLMHNLLIPADLACKYLQKRHPDITFYNIKKKKMVVKKEENNLSVTVINDEVSDQSISAVDGQKVSGKK